MRKCTRKKIIIMSMIRESWRQSLKIEKPVRTQQGEPWHQELLQIKNIDGIQGATLVGASALNVAGLLAAVADTLSGGLLGAVARQMTNLTT
jgi:hypothetical protein